MSRYPAWFEELARKVDNTGRWGSDDEIGTLNFLTPEAVRRAADCVVTGRRFSLALPLSERRGIQQGHVPGRINPLHTMTQLNSPLTADSDGVCINDDVVVLALQTATHWDGLGHVSFGGRIYNGYPAATVGAGGATRCGVEKVRSLVGRGVLLDVARAKGLDRLEPGYAITPVDLDEAAALAAVNVQSGDIVLVRTGQMQLLRQRPRDVHGYATAAGGLSARSAAWFYEHSIAAVATDNYAFEPYPFEDADCVLAGHVLHLVYMGLTQGQNFQLEDLAADCAADGVYEFLLDASPQPFVGGVGSPVNPVAVK